MPEANVRIDIRDVLHASGRTGFAWAVQSTAPVETLCISPGSFETRSAAIKDFQRVCEILGWKNDITEVPVR